MYYTQKVAGAKLWLYVQREIKLMEVTESVALQLNSQHCSAVNFKDHPFLVVDLAPSFKHLQPGAAASIIIILRACRGSFLGLPSSLGLFAAE